MGTDIYGKAGLGICVKGSDLFTTKKVKAYDHDYNNNFKFDPITGKSLWREEKVLKQISGGHEAICMDENEDTWIIVLKHVSAKSPRLYGPMYSGLHIDPILDSTINEFMKFVADMKDIGLWNNTFGLYSWIEVSI